MKTILFIHHFMWVIICLMTPFLLIAQGGQYAPGRMIVRFNEGILPKLERSSDRGIYTNIPQLDDLNQKYTCMDMQHLCPSQKASLPIYSIQLPESTELMSAIDAYRSSGLFVYVEPDYIGHSQGRPAHDSLMPNDTHFDRQWSLYNDGTFWAAPVKVDADIDMTEAWMVEQGDTNTVVGIIDTGCKLDHPDLNGRIWVNKLEIPGNGIDDDGNGYTDDWRGWDFANNDNDPTDDYGHGTNVAGIIGCNGNNSLGFAGVNWHCKLMILKGINDQNWGYYTWWISAINYSVNKGVNVLNLSLGGTDPSQGLTDAVTSAIQNGVTVVASMMNTNNNIAYIPASIPGVIAVGSTDPDDTRSNPFFWSPTSGSCYGPHISVVAPGNYIYGLDYQSNTNYNSYWGGTSQAAPHVAGLASLLKEQDQSRTPAIIKAIIQSTAEDQVGDQVEDTPGWDQYYGYGRINAYQALIYYLSAVRETSTASFRIFPNPASVKAVIDWNPTEFKPSEIRIQSMQGQTVFESTIESNSGEKIAIDTQVLSPGIYMVFLHSKDKSYIQKLVVAR